MKSLQEFYQDKETRENVQAFLNETLERMAVKRVFAKEDISGIADAKEAIDEAFRSMEELFVPQPERKPPLAEAR